MSNARALNRLGFSFTKPAPPDDVLGHAADVERDFAGVVDTVLARTRIDSELQAATARLARNMSEADLAVQQRLRVERGGLDATLMKLAEARREAQLE